MPNTKRNPEKNSETKEKFAQSLKKLLRKRTFDNITVSEIVENCELSRQTFYRYFQDKYDLVNWTYGRLVDKTMRLIGSELTWDEAVVAKLQRMKEESYFYSEVYKSNDYAALLTSDASIVFDYYLDLIATKTSMPLTADERFLLKLYAHGATRMTAHWARTGFPEPPETLARLYKEAAPSFVKRLLFD